MRFKVLLIEDNPADVQLIYEILSESRELLFDIEHESRLSAGLERLDIEGFDAILLDLCLPDSQGIDTFRNLHSKFPMIPIVVLTVQSNESLVASAIGMEAQDYLVKGYIDVQLLTRTLCYAVERKRMEEKLKISEEKFIELFENQPTYCYMISSEGRILDINSAALIALGYVKEEIVGKSLEFIYAPESRPNIIELFEIWKDRGTISDEEMVILTKEGTRRTVLLNVGSIKGKDGQIEVSLSVQTDITNRKRTEEELCESHCRLEEALIELRQTQQQIIQQERLRALGEMASGIAHDFNNALSGIIGYTELILRNEEVLTNPEKVKRSLEIIRIAASDATSMVGRMREFYRSRQENEIFHSVDLNRTIEKAILLTQPKWKSQAEGNGINITIKTNLQSVLPATGNEAELREVLINLIFNAVDAMPDGGTITINTCSDVDRVTFEVCDTGEGMPEYVIQHCMEPFFTTKGDKGTGLGLSVVYGIISRHNGTMEIKSQIGKGTTFAFSLPTYKSKTGETATINIKKLLSHLHVLLVDDDPNILEVLTDYMTDIGHKVTTAMNGREGLEKFFSNRFDLVITDRAMPEMNGDQMIAVIKKTVPNKPVIMLTGFGDIIEVTGESPAGVDIVLKKPLSLAEFEHALAEVFSMPRPV